MLTEIEIPILIMDENELAIKTEPTEELLQIKTEFLYELNNLEQDIALKNEPLGDYDEADFANHPLIGMGASNQVEKDACSLLLHGMYNPYDSDANRPHPDRPTAPPRVLPRRRKPIKKPTRLSSRTDAIDNLQSVMAETHKLKLERYAIERRTMRITHEAEMKYLNMQLEYQKIKLDNQKTMNKMKLDLLDLQNKIKQKNFKINALQQLTTTDAEM